MKKRSIRWNDGVLIHSILFFISIPICSYLSHTFFDRRGFGGYFIGFLWIPYMIFIFRVMIPKAIKIYKINQLSILIIFNAFAFPFASQA